MMTLQRIHANGRTHLHLRTGIEMTIVAAGEILGPNRDPTQGNVHQMAATVCDLYQIAIRKHRFIRARGRSIHTLSRWKLKASCKPANLRLPRAALHHATFRKHSPRRKRLGQDRPVIRQQSVAQNNVKTTNINWELRKRVKNHRMKNQLRTKLIQLKLSLR